MNKELLTNISSYIEQLPPKVQMFVFSGDWIEKTNQIASKYSLSEIQTESLSDIILLILIGLEKPDNFSEKLIVELSISELLAEQIIEEVDERIFDVAIRKITEEDTSISTKIENTIDDIEIRQEITPMIEEGETVQVEPVPIPTPTYTPPQPPIPPNLPTENKIDFLKPPISEAESKPQEKVIQTDIPPKEQVVNELKKYNIDPYREPLE